MPFTLVNCPLSPTEDQSALLPPFIFSGTWIADLITALSYLGDLRPDHQKGVSHP